MVVYQPTVASPLDTATLTLNYDDGVGATSVARTMEGTAVTPADVTISDTDPYDFGIIAVGSVSEHTFTLTNSGDTDATNLNESTLIAPFNYKGGGFPGTGGSCVTAGTILKTVGSCTVVVEFTPTLTGTQPGVLTFSYNDGAAVQIVARTVEGTASAPAKLKISESDAYDFGQTANSGGVIPHTFVITNIGGVDADNLSGALPTTDFIFEGGSYPGTTGTCPTGPGTLAPLATCDVVIHFTPQSVGNLSDTFTMTYDDGVGSGLTEARNVIGEGVAPAFLTISDGATFDYGTVAENSFNDHTFTVTNTGNLAATSFIDVAATLAAPFEYKGGAFPGSGGTCSNTISVGSNCKLVVSYDPTSIATDSDTIELQYFNGITTVNLNRDIEGEAVTVGLIAISDGATFDYGDVAIGGQSDHVFTLDNTGGVPVTLMSGSGLNPPYRFKDGLYPGTGGTCLASLANGANCTIVVTFEPSAAGLLSDSIDITYNLSLIHI